MKGGACFFVCKNDAKYYKKWLLLKCVYNYEKNRKDDYMGNLESINSIKMDKLYNDVSRMIDEAKKRVAIHVNTELVLLNWNIGDRIKKEVLENKKPEYGKKVIKELSKKLIANYGRGYSYSNLYRMLQLNEYFSDYKIFATLSQKLSWSHFVEIVKMDTDIKRRFYATMSSNENWSVRTLKERIDSALFERTAISQRPEQTILNDLQLLNNENIMTTDLFFRDPYILDFLELKDTYSEKDLENAIVNELERFILEMGNDFAFLARQKRIIIDGRDYYIDLLFFHRKLKRLVVIELKLEEFKPEHKGQVELYLKWLDKYEKSDGEETPVAIILCASKSNAIAELLELDKSGIHVAQFLTNYVQKDLLEEKFLSSIKNAKIQLEKRKVEESNDN